MKKEEKVMIFKIPNKINKLNNNSLKQKILKKIKIIKFQ